MVFDPESGQFFSASETFNMARRPRHVFATREIVVEPSDVTRESVLRPILRDHWPGAHRSVNLETLDRAIALILEACAEVSSIVPNYSLALLLPEGYHDQGA
jgi:hypothetical protein